MKKTLYPVFALFFLFSSLSLSGQCIDFINGPIPVPGAPVCGPNCGEPLPFTSQVSPATAWLFEGLVGGNSYEFSLCNSDLPLPSEKFDLVVLGEDGIIVNNVNDCSISFTAPQDGLYLVIFNIVDQCGQPSSIAGFFFEFQVFCPAPCPCPPTFFANRAEAVDLLLDPGSGFSYLPPVGNIWSPFEDFGFGTGREGLLPAGTEIHPFGGGPVMILPFDAYFFWIDDLPLSGFDHPTRFILLDPTLCDPSLENGGILQLQQFWWPVIYLPDLADPLEFFHKAVTTGAPPGPENPDGLLRGNAARPDEVEAGDPPDPAESEKKAGALVAFGDDRNDFSGDLALWKREFANTYQVDGDRIVCPDLFPYTAQEFCDAIDTLCTLTDLDTIYIRITTHGKKDTLLFANNTKLSKQELCEKFRQVAKKGVPVHLFINACHAGSLLDANNWNLPAGSTVITSSASGNYAISGLRTMRRVFPDGTTGMPFMGFTLPVAHAECKKDTTDSDNNGEIDADTNEDGYVDDCEAYRWVESQNPCYIDTIPDKMIGSYTVNTVVAYPAGPADPIAYDTTIYFYILDSMNMKIDSIALGIKDSLVYYPNPMPAIRKVGNFGRTMNFNVQNNSGEAKDRFCMVFAGNVSGGYGAAWESDEEDNVNLDNNWTNGSDVSAVYDPATNETTVCWPASGDAAADQDYVHFGFVAPAGEQLRPVRQYWDKQGSDLKGGTQESVLFTNADKVPTTESEIYLDGSGSPLTVKTVNRSLDAGGWGESVNYSIGYRVSSAGVSLENLNLGNPAITSLDYFPAGTGVLEPDSEFSFDIAVPEGLEPGQSLILQVELQWDLNPNQTMQLILWDSLKPTLCRGDVTYVAGDVIPNQTNSSGTITLDGVTILNGKKTFNGAAGVSLLPGTTIQTSGEDVRMYAFGCDGSLPPTQNLAGESVAGQLYLPPANLHENSKNKANTRGIPFRIMPNPFKGNIRGQYFLEAPAPVSLALYDMNGKVSVQVIDHLPQGEGMHTFEYHTGHLPPGIYFAVLETGGKREYLKLIKMK